MKKSTERLRQGGKENVYLRKLMIMEKGIMAEWKNAWRKNETKKFT